MSDASTNRQKALQILDELDANIALIDQNGVITLVNESWRKFAVENRWPGDTASIPAEEGANYLEACLKASGRSSEGAVLVYEGIRGVLDGKSKSFTHEYPCHSPDKNRWFSMKVKRLRYSKPREAIVIHTEITDRILAELESETRYRELSDALAQLQALATDIRRALALPRSTSRVVASKAPGNDRQGAEQLKMLSQRELEVLKGLIRGERTISVAQRLGVNVKSVSTYRSRILRKLKLDSNAELVKFASRVGFL